MSGFTYTDPSPESENKTFKGKKRHVSGSGNLVNEHGENNLDGNVLIRIWWKTDLYFPIYLVSFAFSAACFLDVFLSPPMSFSSLRILLEKLVLGGWFVISTYVLAAYLLNRTRFEVAKGTLSVKTGPVPLPWVAKELKIGQSNIEQIYVIKYPNDKSDKGPMGLRPYLSHRVYYLPKVFPPRLPDILPKALDYRIRRYDDAKVIEQWIEQKLGITDKSIEDEQNY